METNAQDYRRKSEEAEKASQRTSDYSARETYLEDARLCRELAELHARLAWWTR